MANVTRWNPVRDLIAMREAMDQVFNERAFRNFNTTAVWQLPIDAYATEDAIVLQANVAGLKPEDLNVTIEGDTLTIRGEVHADETNRNYLIRERLTGQFERILTINTPIDTNKVEATFTDGVLTLTLPKAEAVKPKQITVKGVNNGQHNKN